MTHKISIIIRSHNEERWIGRCLKRITNQSVCDPEIILVDNASNDRTVDRARAACAGLRILRLTEFLPGRALNRGIELSTGELIVCLSAHCVPARDDWLEKMCANFEDPAVAGAYGRQIPTSFSHPIDKRDLLVTFGLDRRVQKKDPFFHNANSMIRRQVWKAHPFDETLTNIEDRIWAREVLDAGYTLIYEPEASVYHFHGIHQNNDLDRCDNVVRILEEKGLQDPDSREKPVDPAEVEVAAVIPLRMSGLDGVDDHEPLILKTIAAAKSASHINRIIIAADSPKAVELARKWGVDAPFVRPGDLSAEHVRVDSVFAYALRELERQQYFPDMVLPLEITYPFRPPGLFDKLISRLLESGLDTILAGFREYRPCWTEGNNGFERIDAYRLKRDERPPLYIGLPGLGCATYPSFIREGSRYGNQVGILEMKDPIAGIEIRSHAQLAMFERIRKLNRKDQAFTGMGA